MKKMRLGAGVCVAVVLGMMLAGCRSTQGLALRNGVPTRVLLLDDNEYNNKYKRPGPMPECLYVTIHNTANSAPAINERNYLNNRRDEAYISFHYAVDEKECIQILKHSEHGWHAGDGHGDGNMKSIGVEICRSLCRGEDDHLYREAEANAVKLAAWLLWKEGLSVKDLRMHHSWSPKKCPHRILEENRWDEFKSRVARSLWHLKRAEKTRRRFHE